MSNEEDKQPFETSVFITMLIATFFIPIVGIVMGAMNVKSPNRNGQSCMLMTWGFASAFIHFCGYVGAVL